VKRALVAVLFFPATAAASDFGDQGDVHVSAERLAQAIVVEHARANDRVTDVVAIGDTLLPGPVERLPRLAIDVAIFRHLTLGLAGTYAHGEGKDAWTLAPRVGLAYRVAKRIALLPHVGLEHAEAGGSSRTQLALDPTIGLFLGPDTALTATPAFELPLGTDGGTRFTFTGGLLARFGDGSDALSPPLDRFGTIILTAERLAPIVSYTKELHAPAARGTATTLALGPSHAFDVGAPSRAGLGLDVVLGAGFTFGGTLGLDLVPWESSHAEGTTAHGVKAGISPRVGWVRRIGDSAAIWFRAGLTYTAAIASYERLGAPRAHELDLALEPLFVFFATRGIGFTVGPSATMTVLASHGGASAPLDEVGTRAVALGAALGFLVPL
jgi:hypothetical protein